MKPQSAKAKGRALQKMVRDILLLDERLKEDDVQSRSMGAGGEDLMLSPAAREIYPVSIECKNSERVNVWEAYKQAQANAGNYIPVTVIKKNRHKPLVVLDAVTFFTILRAWE